jgi:hypothetical protein
LLGAATAELKINDPPLAAEDVYMPLVGLLIPFEVHCEDEYGLSRFGYW